MEKTKFKKSLSILLSIIMLVATCSISFSVFAEEDGDTILANAITALNDYVQENNEVLGDSVSGTGTFSSPVQDSVNAYGNTAYYLLQTSSYDDYLVVAKFMDLYQAAADAIVRYDTTYGEASYGDVEIITTATANTGVNSTTASLNNSYTVNVVMRTSLAAKNEAEVSATCVTSSTGATTTYTNFINYYNYYSQVRGTAVSTMVYISQFSYFGGTSAYPWYDSSEFATILTTTDVAGYLDAMEDSEKDYGLSYTIRYTMSKYQNGSLSVSYFAQEGSIYSGTCVSDDFIAYNASAAYLTTIDTNNSYIGSCGYTNTDEEGNVISVDEVYYAFDPSTGTLTIYGEGAMENFSNGGTPFLAFVDSLTTIIVEDGVTTLGNYAFKNLTKVTSISLPTSLTTIGVHMFYGCTSLTTISIPEGVTTIGSGAFRDCTALTTVILPSTINSTSAIGANSFANCTSLTTIYYTGDEWVSTYYDQSGTVTPNSYSDSKVVIHNECYGTVGKIMGGADATCYSYEETYWEGVCDTCGNTAATWTTYGSTLAAHTPVADTDTNKAATCTTTGWAGATVCEVCDKVVDAGYELETIAHTYSSDYTGEKDYYTNPTCTDNGYWTVYCTVCGTGEKTIEVDKTATGCDFPTAAELSTTAENYTPATCQADGYWSNVACENGCGVTTTVTNEGSQESHNFLEFVETIAPSCYAQGYTTYQCSMCDTTENRDYTNMVDHTYDYELDDDDNPTDVLDGEYTYANCGSDGYTTYTCNVDGCGYSYKVYSETDLASNYQHSYKVVSETDSSCTVAGYIHYECAACGDEYDEAKELADHTFNIKIGLYTYGTCQSNEIWETKCFYCDAIGYVELQDTYGECEDSDGDSFCDTCGTIIEDSFWDQLIRFFLEFFEVIASWFS